MPSFSLPRIDTPISRQAARSGAQLIDQDWYRFLAGLQTIFGVSGTLSPSAGGTGVNNGTSTITVAGPFVVAANGGTISFPAPGTVMTLPAASKTLMATDFTGASAASGDLSGSYPGPTVAKINGTPLGATTPTAGNLLIGSGTSFVSRTMSGGATINSSGVVTLTGGVSPSGAASGDLSGTYPSPTVAKINGVALGTTTATAGNLLVGSGSQWASVAMSGDATITAGGVVTVSSTATHAGANLTNPAGSASLAGVMMGLAIVFTASRSGIVHITISGDATNSNSGGSLIAAIRIGTGAAPVNGAALTGSQQSSAIQGSTAAANQKLPISITCLSTFSVGVATWIDMSLSNNGGGTASLENLCYAIIEI